MTRTKVLLFVVLTISLNGCAVVDTFNKPDVLNQKTMNAYKANKMKADSAIRELTRDKSSEFYSIKELPFVSGKAVKRRARLPDIFNSKVLWNFPEPEGVTVGELTRMFYTKTGYRVWLPDALKDDTAALSASMNNSTTDSSGFNVEKLSTADKGDMGEMAQEKTLSEELIYLDIHEFTPIYKVLEMMSVQTGYEWNVEEDEKIVQFNKYFTQTFNIDREISHTGIMPSAIFSGSTRNSSRAKLTDKGDFWKGLPQEIEGFLSENGRVSVSEIAGTVTITDNKLKLKDIAKYIARLNKSLRGEVLFNIEVIEYQFYDEGNKGLDFNVSLLAGNDQFSIASAAGMLNGSILSPNSDVKSGSWQGSSAVIDALNLKGYVSKNAKYPVRALNNKIGTMSNSNLKGYLASATAPITSTNGSTTGGGLELDYINSGQVINIIPHILDGGDSVMVNIGMNISALNKIDPISSGGQTLQSPDVSIKKLESSLKLRNGETVILLPIIEDESENKKSGWMDSAFWWLGGSDKRRIMRRATIVTITPYIFN